MALHDAAIRDEYFVKRRLAPNVDFWYVPSCRTLVPLREYSLPSSIFSLLKNQEVSSYVLRSGDGVEEQSLSHVAA